MPIHPYYLHGNRFPLDFILSAEAYVNIKKSEKCHNRDTSLIDSWLREEKVDTQVGNYRFSRDRICRGQQIIAYRNSHGDFFDWYERGFSMPDSMIPVDKRALEALIVFDKWENYNYAAKCSKWEETYPYWRFLPKNLLISHCLYKQDVAAFLFRKYPDVRVICSDLLVDRQKKLDEWRTNGVNTLMQFIGVTSRGTAIKLKLKDAETDIVDAEAVVEKAKASREKWLAKSLEKNRRYEIILKASDEKLIDALCHLLDYSSFKYVMPLSGHLKSKSDKNGFYGIDHVIAHVFQHKIKMIKNMSSKWYVHEIHEIHKKFLPQTERHHDYINKLPDEIELFFVYRVNDDCYSFQAYENLDFMQRQIGDHNKYSIVKGRFDKASIVSVLFADDGNITFFVKDIPKLELLANFSKKSSNCEKTFDHKFRASVMEWLADMKNGYFNTRPESIKINYKLY